MEYYLHVIYLEGCPHSRNAHELLVKNNIKHKLTRVTHNNKDIYKTDLISTFPQIYLKKNNTKGSILLGGNSDLNNIYNITRKEKNNAINAILKLHKNIKSKLSLRIYELFTKKY